MAKSSLSMIGRAARMATIGATRCTGDVAQAVLGRRCQSSNINYSAAPPLGIPCHQA